MGIHVKFPSSWGRRPWLFGDVGDGQGDRKSKGQSPAPQHPCLGLGIGPALAWGLALPLAQSPGVEFGLVIPGQKSMWCGGLGGLKLRFKSWLQYHLAALWLSVFMTVQAGNNNLCPSPMHTGPNEAQGNKDLQSLCSLSSVRQCGLGGPHGCY